MGWGPVSLRFSFCNNMLLQMENLKATGSHPINSRCPQFLKALSPTSDESGSEARPGSGGDYHENEQITWLIEGEMDFYSNDKKKLLKTDLGVSIGPNHVHGGVSGGALGFDAFFPKRDEKKYKKDVSQ